MHRLPPLCLTQNSIDLWLCFPQEVTAPSLLAQYEGLLTSDEMIRKNRFHFQKHRQLYLITRAMEKDLLSRYSGIAMAELVLKRNAYGKPMLQQNSRGSSRLHYNISHTEGLIVLALCKGRQIGVDVESTQRKIGYQSIIQSYFSNAEVDDIEQQTTEQKKNNRFYDYWTLKEAYIKGIGKGLSTALQNIQFKLSHDNKISCIDNNSTEHGAWQQYLFTADHAHTIAVSVASTSELLSGVHIRKMIPMC